MTDPSSNTASFQLKNVVDSISNSHQQSNLDSRFISDSISLISNNSLISSSHSQSSFDSNSSRVLKSYLSTTSSLLKINSSSSSTTTSTSSNRYRILLSTLLATQFIQQLGLNHSLLSSSSNSTSLLEQWLNSSSNLLLSNSSSKNLILDDDSTISTQLLASILDLITNHLLGSKSGLKADYHRNVVVKNVPKLANGLLNLLDNLHHIVEQRGALDKETEKKMYLILASLDLQLLLHTSLYRPLSSKIHSQLLKLLFTSSTSSISTSKTLINSTSILLSHLHLTGVPSSVITKPSAHNSNNQTRTSQPVLWKSTLDSTLNSSIETWKAFIKDFPKSNHHESQVELDDLLKSGAASRLDLKPLNENGDGDVLLESLKRLRVLFGEKGLLETLLTTSTTRYIPLPAYKIISFCCLILSTIPPPPPSSNSNASNHFINTSISSTINSTTFAFQKSHLIEIQSMALKIGLLTLSIIEDQITISHKNLGPKLLETILNLLSNKHLNTNSSFKAMCFKTLAVLICTGTLNLNPSEEKKINGIGLLLDPNDRNLIKLARFSLGQIGRFLNTRSSTGVEQSTSNTSSGNRQNKKPKLSDQSENDVSNYNSIATHLWPNFSISENDFSSTKSSLYILINLYPFFQTKLNKNLKELESLTNNVLLGLVELLLNNRCLGSGNVSLLMNRNISTQSFQVNENLKKLDDLTCLTISSLNQILKYLDQISLAKVLPRLLKLVNTYSLKGNSLSPRIADGLNETRQLAEMILMPRSVPFVSEDIDLEETPLEEQDEDVEMEQEEEVDPKGKGKQVEMGLNSKDKSKLKSWGIGQDDEDQIIENSNLQKDQDQGQDQDKEEKDQDQDQDQDEEMLDQQEKEIQQQKRSDIDAFKQTLNDQKSSTNIGGGRKSSSSTNFSPDPVKSIRRPSTPRIGSPTSKSNNNPPNPEHSMGGGNFEAKEVFGRQSEKDAEVREEKRKEKEKEEKVKALEMEVDDDDDDDDEMPEIDMRGSEDESEGEE